MRKALAFLALAAWLAGGCGVLGIGDDLPDDTPGLIEALASPNYFPRVEGYGIIYPEGFDHRAQERVRRAERKLRKKGFAAVPHLMQYLEDIRYSYTERFDTWHNHALGEVCFYIIEDLVEVRGFDYASRIGADGKEHDRPSYLWSVCMQGKMQQWWQERAGRSLCALRIEAGEWTLAEERKIGFTDPAQERRVTTPLLKRLGELKSQQEKDLQ